MKKTNTAAALLASFVLALGVAGCDREGPAERMGEDVDDSVERAGERTEEAVENMGDSAERAGDRIEQRTDP